MIIVEESPGAPASIHDVIIDAFGQAGEATLVADLRRDGDLVISLVAEMDGTACGHVAFSRMRSPQAALALAPLAVVRHRQRMGIGSALVRAGIEQARVLGYEMVFVLGNPDYYRRFGFSLDVAQPYPGPYAGPDFMALQLSQRPLAPEPAVHARAFDRLA